VSGPFNGYDTVIVVQMFGEPFGSGVANSLTQPQTAGAQSIPTPKPAVGRALARNLEVASSSATTEESGTQGQLIKPEELQTSNIVPVQSAAPLIDPVIVFKYAVFVIGMFFIILLGIDGYVIARKRVQRPGHGHSLLHALFLAVIMISLLIIETGVIL
jgi:hypothetical protein